MGKKAKKRTGNRDAMMAGKVIAKYLVKLIVSGGK